MNSICYNGMYYTEQEPVLLTNNKSYRYGDGFFETIKVWNGKILLPDYHQNRIENSIRLLHYQLPTDLTISHLFSQTIALCIRNNCGNAARVRLSFFPGNGRLFDTDHPLHYIIEADPLDVSCNNFDKNGLRTGIFSSIKKTGDNAYANLKTASALLYSIAARYARQQKWDDCLILNDRGNVCETCVSNIFWIKHEIIYTPPLQQGGVDGVMRAYLLDQISTIVQKPCTIQDVKEADEMFTTNAIRGVRWVANIYEIRQYSNAQTETLYQKYILPLF